MALARVVTFEGVDSGRMRELVDGMESGEPPEGMPDSELIVLHDPDAEKSIAILIFDSEDDYQRGHEILDAMPSENTPGRRTSVTKYDVAARMTTDDELVLRAAPVEGQQHRRPAPGLDPARV